MGELPQFEKIVEKVRLKILSISSIFILTPSSNREVTPLSDIPQGLMLLKNTRLGLTFNDRPWNVTHFLTLNPSAAIFLSCVPSEFMLLGFLTQTPIIPGIDSRSYQRAFI